MIKKIVICVSALSLTACLAPNQLNYAKAKHLCEPYGGLYKFHSVAGITCKNGTAFTVNQVNEARIPVEEIGNYFTNESTQ